MEIPLSPTISNEKSIFDYGFDKSLNRRIESINPNFSNSEMQNEVYNALGLAGINVKGSQQGNFFAGYQAGSVNTTGNNNTFVGFQAGFANTTGYNNFFAGIYAGKLNTAGNDNTFIGTSAGCSCVGGYRNLAIGNASGQKMINAFDNVFVGFASGWAVTSGFRNVAIGLSSFGGQLDPEVNATTGNYNVCIGDSSGAKMTTGSSNIFLGFSAGVSNGVGNTNIFIGDSSGYLNTSGSTNIFIGQNSGLNNISGSTNVFLGNYSGYYETASNKLFIDNQARASEADARLKALIYGIFATTTAGQSLYLNSNVYISDTLYIGGTAISSLYQPLDADLAAIAALSSADSNFIVGSAAGWVAESGATARTSLGLGTGDSPTFAGGSFYAPDVAHGMTGLAPTNIFGIISVRSSTVGGLDVMGLTDDTDTDTIPLIFTGVFGSNPTDSAPAVVIRGGKKNLTSWQALEATETVFILRNFTTDIITVTGAGNVGIGRIPEKVLDITHTSGDGFRLTRGSHSISFNGNYASADTHSVITSTVALSLRTGGDFERVSISTAGNIKIAGTALRGTTEGTNHLDIFNGTAPVGTLTNGCSIYSASGELYTMDAAGNATLQTPHDEENLWVFNSINTVTGKRLVIDMEKMMRFLNKKFGLNFIHEFTV